MAAIFPRWTNLIPVVLAAGVIVTVPTVTLAAWYWFMPEYTNVG